jgi:hypothetical protein
MACVSMCVSLVPRTFSSFVAARLFPPPFSPSRMHSLTHHILTRTHSRILCLKQARAGAVEELMMMRDKRDGMTALHRAAWRAGYLSLLLSHSLSLSAMK